MIKNDKEYSITRYWRNMFQGYVDEPHDYDQNAMEVHVVASYQSMVNELNDEMEEYLTKNHRTDEEFCDWTPEASGEPAVFIRV